VAYKIRNRDEHFLNDGGPKRILALDGGGLRGILTLLYLAEIESLLRERHGGRKDFCLAHYFDLIASTSTGAIIAAALACGMSVADISEKYMTLGKSVFVKGLLDFGKDSPGEARRRAGGARSRGREESTSERVYRRTILRQQLSARTDQRRVLQIALG